MFVCLQTLLCTVDIVLECHDQLPDIANEERLTRLVTEKVMEHGVSCPDLRELHRSPDSLMRMPAGIVCVCCSNYAPPSPSQADERAVPVRHTLKEALRMASHHTRVT